MAKLLLSMAVAGLVGQLAVASLASLVQPGPIRDIGVVVLWVAAIGAGTIVARAWVMSDRPPVVLEAGGTLISAPQTRSPADQLNDVYWRGRSLFGTLDVASGSSDDTARAARSAVDKWEAEARSAIKAAAADLEAWDAPITGLDGMHYADRPAEALRIKLERLRILLH